MKKILSLLLSLLSFALVLSSCAFTSPENEFSLPEDTSPVLKVPYDQLQVDWDKAIEDVYTIFFQAYGNQFNLSSLSISVQSNIIKIDFPSFYSNMAGNDFWAYEALGFANILLTTLNEAAAQQDSQISSAGEFSYGGIFDVFELRITIGEHANPHIQDTLKPGEHRKRGLLLLTAPFSVDLLKCAKQLNAIYAEQKDIFKSLDCFVSFCSSYGQEKIDYDFDLSVIFSCSVSNKKALQYSEEALITFNKLCQLQDPRITSADQNSYGGIYDYLYTRILIRREKEADLDLTQKDSVITLADIQYTSDKKLSLDDFL